MGRTGSGGKVGRVLGGKVVEVGSLMLVEAVGEGALVEWPV